MLVGLSGPTFTLEPGDIYEPDEAEATRMIASRFAIPFVETADVVPAVEVAAGDIVETATVKPKAEKRKKG